MSFGTGALSGLDSALGTLSSISNTIQGIPVIGRLISGAVSTVAGPIKDLAQLGLGFNDLKENATIAFSVILKDGEKAKKLFADLAKFGKESPIFKTGELITYAQMFLPKMGAGPELFDTLKGIASITAVTGHLEWMESIANAFNQMGTKPKASAEEINQQLAERGVDAWGLAGRAMGMSPGKVQEGVTAGEFSGIGLMKVILGQANREYGSIVDLMGETRQGKQARIDDTVEQLAGQGTTNLHGTWKGLQDRALTQLNGPKGEALAGQINSATGEIGGKVLGGLDSLMDGSLLTKAQEMAQGVVGSVQDTIKGAAASGYGTMAGYAGAVEQGWRDVWEQNSPSAKAKRLGTGVGDSLGEGLIESLERLLKDPRIRAMLDVIGYAEGTDKAHGYATKVGGGNQGDLSQKNRSIVNLGGGLKSSASGRYQFLNKTWDPLAGQLGLTDFSEHSQDLAAVKLLKDSGAIEKLQAGDFEGAIKAAKGKWASFPGAGYGQGERTMGSLEKVYSQSLAIGGSPVNDTNPMPVSIVNFGNLKDINSAGGIFGAKKGSPGPAELWAMQENIKTFGNAAELTKRLDIAKGALAVNDEATKKMFKDKPAELARVQKMNADAYKIGEEAAKAVPSLAKLGETAAMTAQEIEANRKLSKEGLDPNTGKKKKKDKLFDAAFTRSGVAGDFEGGLTGFLSGLGWEKPGGLAKQFGLGLLKDVQGRLSHDFSAMITGALFGGRGGPDQPMTGGILSKLFGSLFGGHRASGGGMSAGRMYIAGENGPEAIMMGQNGYAYNARETRGMMGGGDGRQEISINIGDEAVGRATDRWHSQPKGRRSRMLTAKYGRKLDVSYG